MTTTTTTATVETLAAEVRVLMMGSRQLTLSVARQLDVVPLADMVAIFGRVKLGGGDRYRPPYDYVIGKAIDGALVLARYDRDCVELSDDSIVGGAPVPLHQRAAAAPLIVLGGSK
ncbi:Uncharacterised protein [Mycobacteroides abscessus subsp. abscessus]|uniref:hypothetical protein n=1 Tax=Mycobacteroides abscessus TaxID=36809 RepID=UPI0009258A0D|nr:hypothetical protein [Mycobacteroides abscessus]SHZ99881.1 Uncharacterised protein [Mycobacteroides abscessus subsp. abscessus]SIA00344.1 Uncharacterised protein [Mycobacteroides abscessus subsp. abscessus]